MEIAQLSVDHDVKAWWWRYRESLCAPCGPSHHCFHDSQTLPAVSGGKLIPSRDFTAPQEEKETKNKNRSKRVVFRLCFTFAHFCLIFISFPLDKTRAIKLGFRDLMTSNAPSFEFIRPIWFTAIRTNEAFMKGIICFCWFSCANALNIHYMKVHSVYAEVYLRRAKLVGFSQSGSTFETSLVLPAFSWIKLNSISGCWQAIWRMFHGFNFKHPIYIPLCKLNMRPKAQNDFPACVFFPTLNYFSTLSVGNHRGCKQQRTLLFFFSTYLLIYLFIFLWL